MRIEVRDSDRLRIKAPAKVNLFLEVLGKRPDGYHDINSLFQAVSLYDELTFSITDKPGVMIELTGDTSLPTGDDNLVSRAYTIMRSNFNLPHGLLVNLDKQIPVAAGLGGGSADAAATIIACNLLFDLNLSRTQLARLALEVGSDLPFFFSGGQALVGGRGEVVKSSDYPTNYMLVLVTPGQPVSTAEAYDLLKMDLTKPKVPFTLPPCRDINEFIVALHVTGNDFEDVLGASYPDSVRIRDVLLQAGAVLTRLSGSGPTMFGLFVDAPELGRDATCDWDCWRLFTVKPITWRLEVV
ncbi:MAG: 4-(cytidine 5'-diphospho)-2-C-methyl-D-erythritol kinase [candidate division Zixibacteria bacterium]|nr:4-(cytidine 5'-diphospho)-2-C-methyl-D-erythritol kinase [candidate division Zixibacteria bacterium]